VATERSAECTGPSLAFVPRRGAKDRAQDDRLAVQGMISGSLFQTGPTTCATIGFVRDNLE
jgi:hypothetical protein